MPARIVRGLEELRSLVGQEVGTSDWIQITQEQINQFAEVTGDRKEVLKNRSVRKLKVSFTITIQQRTTAEFPVLDFNIPFLS